MGASEAEQMGRPKREVMLPLLKRHEIQVLRRAGHSRAEVARLPIAARVVRRLLVSARRAHVEVAAEHGGPAPLDVAQRGALLGAQHATLHERLGWGRGRGITGSCTRTHRAYAAPSATTGS
jgi:hypothetical protein